MSNTVMSKESAKIVRAIVGKFADLKGASFVAIKGYESKTTGEIANHVINANFSYSNAVEKDLNALKSATDDDIQAIAEKNNFTVELVRTAIAKLMQSFENNKSDETRSNQSKGQIETYIPITNSIKLNPETGLLHIYALGISKQVLVEGTYKSVNSRELTLCQNAVKKYFNFSTAKYRNFIVNPEMLDAVKISGESIELV